MLSDMLQIPKPLSHIQICPEPKVKLGPTDLMHPAPSLETIISSVSPMGSRSHRDGLANSLLPIAIISVSPRYAIGPTEFAWPTLCFAYYPNRSHRVWVIGQTEFWFYHNPSTLVPPSWTLGLGHMWMWESSWGFWSISLSTLSKQAIKQHLIPF